MPRRPLLLQLASPRLLGPLVRASPLTWRDSGRLNWQQMRKQVRGWGVCCCFFKGGGCRVGFVGRMRCLLRTLKNVRGWAVALAAGNTEKVHSIRLLQQYCVVLLGRGLRLSFDRLWLLASCSLN